MEKEIIRIKIENELDVVIAYKRTMQLSELCGLALGNQTKFSTAVSEICRNVLEHVGQGTIRVGISEARGRMFLEALISDYGRGIYNAEELMAAKYPPSGSKGWGIFNSRKLVDDFLIETELDKGTKVTLRKILPAGHRAITNELIKSWVRHLDNEEGFSPYAEIKRQNMHLLELMEQLRLKGLETEAQLQEITRLNDVLKTSNHEISDLLFELENKNVALGHSNRELDQFANVVSHELKAPLLNIKSLALITTECLESNDLVEAADTMIMLQKQADRMDKLITDILFYSATGKQKTEKTIVSLHDLLNEEIKNQQVPAHFKIDIQPGMPVLKTESVFLSQVFSNLLSNAIKYNDKPEGRIVISSFKDGNFLQFSVADNGLGIHKADQQKVFNMYEMLDHRNQKGSTGIGLSIVKKIVTLKGGQIWIESKPGEGADFIFTWPVSEIVKI